MIRLRTVAEGVVVAVKVMPNASRDEVVGALGEFLKVKVSKPPEGGAANAAVEKLLTEVVGVSKSRVSVVAGFTQPRKDVLIRGATEAEVRGKLL